MAGVDVRAMHALEGHRDKVWSLAFAPDGRTLASGGEDRVVLLWDVEAYQERCAFRGPGDGVNSVAFSPGGNLLAAGGEGGAVRLWHLGRPGGWCRGRKGGVNQVAFSPDGRLLAAVGGEYGQPGQVRLWDVSTGRERANFVGHRDEVMTVAFSPSGALLLTGDFAGELKLWDLAWGELRRTIPAHVGAVWKAAFVGDDRALLSAGEDGALRFWRGPDGRPLTQLDSHTFGVLSFSTAGSLLAAGHFNGELLLWDLAGAPLAYHLASHGAPVFAVAFSSDGRLVASAGADARVLLWQLGAAPDRPAPSSRRQTIAPLADAITGVLNGHAR